MERQRHPRPNNSLGPPKSRRVSAQRAKLRRDETGDDFPEETATYTPTRTDRSFKPQHLDKKFDSYRKEDNHRPIWLFIILLLIVIFSIAIGFFLPGSTS